MKVVQPTENTVCGRRKIASADELLRYEGLWVGTFCGLRDGVPETEVKTRGTSGMLMKVSGQERLLLKSEQDRETVHVILPGEAPRTVRQSKFTSTPKEIQSWRNRVQREEENFRRITMGSETIMMKVSAFPAERQLWECLKRAHTPAQVRRICSRSKLWLSPRLGFPDGGHMEFWTYRRALYKYAEKFCRAKLDSRYPSRDERESGDYRRIEYLARVMAGLTLGFAASTAVERLRKMKHTRRCDCWRCVLKIGPRYRQSLARFLSQSRRTARS